jgi:protein-disulfide isomerase
VTRSRALGLLFLASFGCSVGLSPRTPPEPTAKGAAGSSSVPPGGQPRPLAGIDQSKLDERQRQAVWDVAQQAFAPCPEEAVSLAQCVEDSRPCASCKPALQFLVGRVGSGAAPANARAALKQRFDPTLVAEVPSGSSPTLGPADAPVTVVVFSDFECPACRAALPFLQEMQEKHSAYVRIVHKFFPLTRHLRARYAARAAYAAQQQGRYWEMEKLIFENQEDLSDATLERLAKEVGLDLDRWREDKDSAEAEKTIDEDVALGDQVGLRRTPFVLINGREFDTDYFKFDDDLEAWLLLERELSASKKRPLVAPSGR